MGLTSAILLRADLTGVDLTEADLSEANLVRAQLRGANLSRARVYGVSAWDLREAPSPENQRDLVITPEEEPDITVDDVEIAQFVYLMIQNKKIRSVIDTLTSKVVLILGAFSPERKVVLDALRDRLRSHNLCPILFDFSVPQDRDITETVTLLARMARFVVADLTNPASIPLELQAFAPDVAVPIRSIVLKGQTPFSMFKTLRKYHWVLAPYEYADLDELLTNLDAEVIRPAEAKRTELRSTR